MRWADQIFSTINSIHAAPHTTRTGTRGELSLAEYFQIEVKTLRIEDSNTRRRSHTKSTY